MSSQLTLSKRPNDQNVNESNRKGKLQKTQNSNDQNLGSSLGNVYFRVVCSASKVDCLIGEDGGAIARISKETGLNVRIVDDAPECDERVVVVESSPKETEGGDSALSKKEEGNVEANAAEEQKEAVSVDDSQSVNGASAVKALLLIFERLVEAETSKDGGDAGKGKLPSSFVLKLLVLCTQVGCILGKGGSMIKLMASESGAQIRILPRDKLPTCASAQDDVVLITGEIDAVKRALHSVSKQLLGNTVKDHHLDSATSLDHSHPRAEANPPAHRSVISRGALYPPGPPEPILTFRILCPEEKVGAVIGKGGYIIKGLQLETGCEIKVMEAVPDCADRLIIVSGSVDPNGRISAVRDAVLRVHARIFRGAPDNQETKTVVTRLLVSLNQIGCLLAKGGSIMAEMRKSTGAYIRVLPKDQIPKCASEGEDVLQINGVCETVLEALMQITTRLQQHFFRDEFPSNGHPSSNPAFFDHPPPPFPQYPGRSELSPPFHLFNDGIGGTPPQRLGFPPTDNQSPFMHNIHRPGMLPHISERNPWGPQGLPEGAAPVGFPDFPVPPHRRMPGFGGSHAAIITNTKLEVVVPRSIVPIIYGEDGACLMQIRQISEAKITITDPKPGARETIIIISGTPEQTNAAQSLIQAFVMSEHESA
ncbi:unnamed protein product [Linum tenue]|uniref:K Homology domain-containing protein n=1 Tax=Linum tenue TaxID=586396 RepID=A0AAV0I7F7_9ROSI|nr:unnamed protein product [Linum tenue]